MKKIKSFGLSDQVIEIPVSYGKIKIFTLGKIHWKDTFPETYVPTDSIGWIEATKKIVSKYTLLPKENIHTLNQVHGREIGLVKGGKIGDWIFDSYDLDHLTDSSASKIDGDGLVTADAKAALVVRTADCVPVYCYSVERPMISILHAGWKGAAGNITEKCIRWMKKNGIEEKSLRVLTGPSIAQKNYQVQADVANYFLDKPKEVIYEEPGKGYYLSVKNAVLHNLIKEFPEIHLERESKDVYLSEEFFSHRSKDKERNFNVILWESSSVLL